MNPSQKTITILLMFILFLSACAPRAEAIPPTETPVPTATSTATAMPTDTPTPLPPTRTPVPTPARPNPPENLAISYACQASPNPWYGLKNQNRTYQILVLLKWEDKSNDEQGFEIYKFGNLLKTVKANTADSSDSFATGKGTPLSGNLEYTILAYNDQGKSLRIKKVIHYSCP